MCFTVKQWKCTIFQGSLHSSNAIHGNWLYTVLRLGIVSFVIRKKTLQIQEDGSQEGGVDVKLLEESHGCRRDLGSTKDSTSNQRPFNPYKNFCCGRPCRCKLTHNREKGDPSTRGRSLEDLDGRTGYKSNPFIQVYPVSKQETLTRFHLVSVRTTYPNFQFNSLF